MGYQWAYEVGDIRQPIQLYHRILWCSKDKFSYQAWNSRGWSKLE